VRKLGSWAKRKKLLEKILVGNIISMSKGLGYTVPGPIEVNILKLREVNTSLKGNPMLGFMVSSRSILRYLITWALENRCQEGLVQ